MTETPRNKFPSKEFLRTHFGHNLPLLGRVDTGFFLSSKYSEVRKQLSYILFSVPHHMIKRIDDVRDSNRSVAVFNGDSLASWLVPTFTKHFAQPESLPADFITDLRREFTDYALQHQPFTKDWWEWFQDGDSIGARFTADAKDYGNRKKVTLRQLFSDSNAQPL